MTQPIVWTIAGSDSGGGAGIQADLKTMNALGVYGCSVVTALTAQNTKGVNLVEPCSSAMLQAQLQALSEDLPPVAIKLGMLGDAEGIGIIGAMLTKHNALAKHNAFIVCDPVMVSTSGHDLRQSNTLEAFTEHLLPKINLLTPNLPEAEILTGQTIRSTQDMETAAQALLKQGAQSVLIKGGHFQSEWSQDFWTDGRRKFWLTSPRHKTRHTHGTGCTLSAAITACIGLGFPETDALVIAKAYVNQGLRLAPAIGEGSGPLTHSGWPETHEDLPWLTPTAEEGQNRPEFTDCGSQPLGFYPVVNRLEWLEKLLPLGVSTIQLRIKDLEGEDLEREIAQASAYARSFNCRLFINDYWQLALKYGAYGVHLGQEDLETANLQAIEEAGLKLGLSTHCYQEVARALSIRPSYIAVGPVFHTSTKTMRFKPQGLEAVRRWRRSLPYPLVAIAGIFLDNAPEVLATGVDSVAVVRDITQSVNLPERVAQWLALFEKTSSQPVPFRP
jgi:hydroxymethylpyrimidine kinase/phosphomethylpyrimidine kinase/thiamine-phosphate diphosphorylase